MPGLKSAPPELGGSKTSIQTKPKAASRTWPSRPRNTPFMNRLSLKRNGSVLVSPVLRLRRSHVPLMNAIALAPRKLFTVAGSESGPNRTGGPRTCDCTPGKNSTVVGIARPDRRRDHLRRPGRVAVIQRSLPSRSQPLPQWPGGTLDATTRERMSCAGCPQACYAALEPTDDPRTTTLAAWQRTLSRNGVIMHPLPGRVKRSLSESERSRFAGDFVVGSESLPGLPPVADPHPRDWIVFSTPAGPASGKSCSNPSFEAADHVAGGFEPEVDSRRGGKAR